MIRIHVLSRQGLPMAQPPSAQFGPDGGTIGRAASNTLVLDDPDRTVSRVHAQVLHRDGRYVLVDRGSNPLACNGAPVGNGQEVELRGGDKLTIGSFELSVTLQAPAAAPALLPPEADGRTQIAAPGGAADDPFADLLAGLAPAAAPASPAAAAPASAGAAPAAGVPDPFADPLGAPPSTSSSAAAVDPFADLLGAGSPAAGTSAALPADDFSDLGLPAAANPTAHAARIDELFGGMDGGLGGDPLALSPLADPLLQPNTAARDDPLAAFGQAPEAAPSARSDHLPIGQFGFSPPQAKAPAPPPAAAPMPAGDDEVLFDDQTGQPIRLAPKPVDVPAPAPVVAPAAGGSAQPAAPAAAFDDLLAGLAPAAPAAPATTGASIPASPPARPVPAAAPVSAAPLAVPAPPGTPAGAAGQAELFAALLQGLGPMHQAPVALTPELMTRLGALLRVATEGTLQLLIARQEVKKGVRAEVTMIAGQANNPLKFSPTAEVAMAHLLGTGVRGFMGPEEAMRDAYDDLRAHEFGVMVGMRAALAHVLARFTPAELESRIAARSALDALFSANRKAKLWDQFVALYGGIAAEAEDDFHSLFGKAFVQAYEEQMTRFKSSR